MAMVVASTAHTARRAAKRLRKRLRRAKSVGQAAGLWLRNTTSRQSVLGTLPVSVSLTSYGDRLRTVALAIESIAAGQSLPSRLILWLDDDAELPDGKLPKSLQRLQRRGLEIRVAPNVGPHGKYFGYVNSLSHHHVPLLTADDDIMYPRRWLTTLYDAHLRHPQEIHCYWAKRITASNGQIDHYQQWPVVTDTAPFQGNFALGVSGVIYPPAMLNELARRGNAFEDFCPKADDIWLHWTALQAGIKIRQTEEKAHHFPLIPGTQGNSLLQSNVDDGGNNSSIQGLYSEGDILTLNKSLSVWAT